MFRPVPMMRATILILDKDLASVTKEIGRLGIMHLVEVGSTPGLSDMGWTPGQEREGELPYRCSSTGDRTECSLSEAAAKDILIEVTQSSANGLAMGCVSSGRSS